MTKKVLLIPLALLLAVSLVAVGCPEPVVDVVEPAPEVFRWDLPVVWPAGNFHTVGVIEFARLVEERSEGRLIITVHPGGALGFAGPEMLGVVRDRLAPIGEMLLPGLVGEEPLLGLSTMPFLMETYEDAFWMETIARPYYEAIFARWNQRVLYMVPWPMSGIFTMQPIHEIDDFKGLMTRGFCPHGARFSVLAEGTGVMMPWGEVFMALLAKGFICSVITSTISGVDGKLWEVTPHFHRLDFSFPLNAVTVNLDAWEDLPGDIQVIVLDTAREIEARQWLTSKKIDVISEARLIEEGITVTRPGPELAAALREIGELIWAEWIEKVGPEAEAVITEFKELVGR